MIVFDVIFAILEMQKDSPFNLSFPPLRTGTYPNIISADVDLAAEVEREHRKIKEERARKQREKEMEENQNRKQAQENEKQRAKDSNQNWVGGKSEESKATGSAVAKKPGMFFASFLLR